MTKIELIEDYISKCEQVLETKEYSNAYSLYCEIYNVYSKTIPEIDNSVLYSIMGADKRCLEEIQIIKSVLTSFKANLEYEDEIRKDELEKRKLKQSILNINNTNTNSANATATSTVTITIEQTIKNICQIPDTILSQSEKEELEEKISALEVAKNNPTKLKSKLPNVLKYIADKGVEVGIALLPYLGEITKMIK